MNRKQTMKGVVAALAAAGFAMAAQAQTTPFSPEVQEHLKEAMKNSGGDFGLINHYRTFSCDATEDTAMYSRSNPDRNATRVPLTRLFDNVWYIGDMYVGQYIMKTASGGFVLIDALNNGAEVDEYTMPALQSLGLGAANPLLAVLISHGHGDHDGGANRLRALFGPSLAIYIGSGDAGNKAYQPITVDSANPEPQEITVGGTTFVWQSIPGHTNGMMNFVVPVQQGGNEYKLMMGGRQGHPGNINSARNYLTGTERSYRLIQRYGVVGTFLTHPTSDGSTVNMQAIVRTGSREPNPFFIGHDRALRAAAIWRGCAAAWLATRDATADVPVWRVTSLTFQNLAPNSSTVSAQLLTGWSADDPDRAAGWGATPGQAVTFSVDRGGSCSAVTDADGVASCQLSGKLLPTQRVTATFAGSTAPNLVNLATSASAVVPTR